MSIFIVVLIYSLFMALLGYFLGRNAHRFFKDFFFNINFKGKFTSLAYYFCIVGAAATIANAILNFGLYYRIF